MDRRSSPTPSVRTRGMTRQRDNSPIMQHSPIVLGDSPILTVPTSTVVEFTDSSMGDIFTLVEMGNSMHSMEIRGEETEEKMMDEPRQQIFERPELLYVAPDVMSLGGVDDEYALFSSLDGARDTQLSSGTQMLNFESIVGVDNFKDRSDTVVMADAVPNTAAVDLSADVRQHELFSLYTEYMEANRNNSVIEPAMNSSLTRKDLVLASIYWSATTQLKIQDRVLTHLQNHVRAQDSNSDDEELLERPFVCDTEYIRRVSMENLVYNAEQHIATLHLLYSEMDSESLPVKATEYVELSGSDCNAVISMQELDGCGKSNAGIEFVSSHLQGKVVDKRAVFVVSELIRPLQRGGTEYADSQFQNMDLASYSVVNPPKMLSERDMEGIRQGRTENGENIDGFGKAMKDQYLYHAHHSNLTLRPCFGSISSLSLLSPYSMHVGGVDILNAQSNIPAAESFWCEREISLGIVQQQQGATINDQTQCIACESHEQGISNVLRIVDVLFARIIELVGVSSVLFRAGYQLPNDIPVQDFFPCFAALQKYVETLCKMAAISIQMHKKLHSKTRQFSQCLRGYVTFLVIMSEKQRILTEHSALYFSVSVDQLSSVTQLWQCMSTPILAYCMYKIKMDFLHEDMNTVISNYAQTHALLELCNTRQSIFPHDKLSEIIELAQSKDILLQLNTMRTMVLRRQTDEVAARQYGSSEQPTETINAQFQCIQDIFCVFQSTSVGLQDTLMEGDLEQCLYDNNRLFNVLLRCSTTKTYTATLFDAICNMYSTINEHRTNHLYNGINNRVNIAVTPLNSSILEFIYDKSQNLNARKLLEKMYNSKHSLTRRDIDISMKTEFVSLTPLVAMIDKNCDTHSIRECQTFVWPQTALKCMQVCLTAITCNEFEMMHGCPPSTDYDRQDVLIKTQSMFERRRLTCQDIDPRVILLFCSAKVSSAQKSRQGPVVEQSVYAECVDRQQRYGLPVVFSDDGVDKEPRSTIQPVLEQLKEPFYKLLNHWQDIYPVYELSNECNTLCPIDLYVDSCKMMFVKTSCQWHIPILNTAVNLLRCISKTIHNLILRETTDELTCYVNIPPQTSDKDRNRNRNKDVWMEMLHEHHLVQPNAKNREPFLWRHENVGNDVALGALRSTTDSLVACIRALAQVPMYSVGLIVTERDAGVLGMMKGSERVLHQLPYYQVNEQDAVPCSVSLGILSFYRCLLLVIERECTTLKCNCPAQQLYSMYYHSELPTHDLCRDVYSDISPLLFSGIAIPTQYCGSNGAFLLTLANLNSAVKMALFQQHSVIIHTHTIPYQTICCDQLDQDGLSSCLLSKAILQASAIQSQLDFINNLPQSKMVNVNMIERQLHKTVERINRLSLLRDRTCLSDSKHVIYTPTSVFIDHQCMRVCVQLLNVWKSSMCVMLPSIAWESLVRSTYSLEHVNILEESCGVSGYLLKDSLKAVGVHTSPYNTFCKYSVELLTSLHCHIALNMPVCMSSKQEKKAIYPFALAFTDKRYSVIQHDEITYYKCIADYGTAPVARGLRFDRRARTERNRPLFVLVRWLKAAQQAKHNEMILGSLDLVCPRILTQLRYYASMETVGKFLEAEVWLQHQGVSAVPIVPAKSFQQWWLNCVYPLRCLYAYNAALQLHGRDRVRMPAVAITAGAGAFIEIPSYILGSPSVTPGAEARAIEWYTEKLAPGAREYLRCCRATPAIAVSQLCLESGLKQPTLLNPNKLESLKGVARRITQQLDVFYSMEGCIMLLTPVDPLAFIMQHAEYQVCSAIYDKEWLQLSTSMLLRDDTPTLQSQLTSKGRQNVKDILLRNTCTNIGICHPAQMELWRSVAYEAEFHSLQPLLQNVRESIEMVMPLQLPKQENGAFTRLMVQASGSMSANDYTSVLREQISYRGECFRALVECLLRMFPEECYAQLPVVVGQWIDPVHSGLLSIGQDNTVEFHVHAFSSRCQMILLDHGIAAHHSTSSLHSQYTDVELGGVYFGGDPAILSFNTAIASALTQSGQYIAQALFLHAAENFKTFSRVAALGTASRRNKTALNTVLALLQQTMGYTDICRLLEVLQWNDSSHTVPIDLKETAALVDSLVPLIQPSEPVKQVMQVSFSQTPLQIRVMLLLRSLFYLPKQHEARLKMLLPGGSTSNRMLVVHCVSVQLVRDITALGSRGTGTVYTPITTAPGESPVSLLFALKLLLVLLDVYGMENSTVTADEICTCMALLSPVLTIYLTIDTQCNSVALNTMYSVVVLLVKLCSRLQTLFERGLEAVQIDQNRLLESFLPITQILEQASETATPLPGQTDTAEDAAVLAGYKRITDVVSVYAPIPAGISRALLLSCVKTVIAYKFEDVPPYSSLFYTSGAVRTPHSAADRLDDGIFTRGIHLQYTQEQGKVTIDCTTHTVDNDSHQVDTATCVYTNHANSINNSIVSVCIDSVDTLLPLLYPNSKHLTRKRVTEKSTENKSTENGEINSMPTITPNVYNDAWSFQLNSQHLVQGATKLRNKVYSRRNNRFHDYITEALQGRVTPCLTKAVNNTSITDVNTIKALVLGLLEQLVQLPQVKTTCQQQEHRYLYLSIDEAKKRATRLCFCTPSSWQRGTLQIHTEYLHAALFVPIQRNITDQVRQPITPIEKMLYDALVRINEQFRPSAQGLSFKQQHRAGKTRLEYLKAAQSSDYDTLANIHSKVRRWVLKNAVIFSIIPLCQNDDTQTNNIITRMVTSHNRLKKQKVHAKTSLPACQCNMCLQRPTVETLILQPQRENNHDLETLAQQLERYESSIYTHMRFFTDTLFAQDEPSVV